jgi:hypothetical protein
MRSRERRPDSFIIDGMERAKKMRVPAPIEYFIIGNRLR